MKIVITRPLENCDSYLLEQPFLFLPVVRYEFCDTADLNYSDETVFILTSQAASRFVIDNCLPKKNLYYCVGKKTGDILVENGYKRALYPQQYNVQHLVDLIVANHSGNTNYLYLSGDVVAQDIQKKLQEKHIMCSRFIAYKIRPIEQLWKNVLNDHDEYVFVFYSFNSYRYFLDNMRGQHMLHLCQTNIVCFVLPHRTKEFVFNFINDITWKKYFVFDNTHSLINYFQKA